MRKFLIPLAAAASTMAFAAPASAQWYPQPRHGYGYNNFGHNLGQARALQLRVDRVQQEIRRLANYRMLSPAQYRNLRSQSVAVERTLRREARDGRGLTAREAFNVERRIVRLEQRLQQQVARNMRYGNRYAYGYAPRW